MKNNAEKIAIYGGSFDPPHFGHIDIVRNLERHFDKVIVMPSNISPFKSEQSGSSDEAKVRFSLCKKVFSSAKTEVSRYELNKKGISYSVDTAAHLAKKTGAKLFWVIGSEELGRLSDWRNIDKLKTLVTFYVVSRPHYEINADTLKSLKKRKVKIKLAPFGGLDISSTEAKIDIAFGKPNKYLPTVVADAVKFKGMFDPYGKYVAALYRYGLTDKRIEHTYGVAIRGMELAKIYGISVSDAVTACILHDIAKSVDPEDYKDKFDFSAFPKPTAHAPIGAYIAEREFNVSDEIAHAIYIHSTGDEDMTPLDETVYLADKTERGRGYKSLYFVRYLSETNRALAMRYALNEISGLDGSELNPYSERALRYYNLLCDGTEYPKMPERVVAPPKPSINVQQEKKEKQIRQPVKEFVSTGDEIKDIAFATASELSLHKAHNVDIVSLGDSTVIADYFVIASASSTTAVKALMGYVEDRLTKQFGIDPSRRDINSEWIALDYGSVIIHIFTDKTREFYNIERLWSDGNNILRYED